MKKNGRNAVRQLLDDYLETNNLRRTPERYAILDAVYSIRGHFSLEELDQYLVEHDFRVSRATLYNNLRLFRKLRLVVCHRLPGGAVYESCCDNKNQCHQICTVCGKVSEVNAPSVAEAVNETKLRRFKKDGFTLYIYGVCSTCQALMTRKKMNKERTKNIK